ncbi:MAG: hypothetical protein AAB879_00745 [Patescibacteria group bacterium]
MNNQNALSHLVAKLIETARTLKSIDRLDLTNVRFDESPFAEFSGEEFAPLGLSSEDRGVRVLVAIHRWTRVDDKGLDIIERAVAKLTNLAAQRMLAEKRACLLAEIKTLDVRSHVPDNASVETLERMIRTDRGVVLGWIAKAVERVNALAIVVGETLVDANVDDATQSTLLRARFDELLSHESGLKARRAQQDAIHAQRQRAKTTFALSQAEGEIRTQCMRLGLPQTALARKLDEYRATGMMPSFTRRSEVKTRIPSRFEEKLARIALEAAAAAE